MTIEDIILEKEWLIKTMGLCPSSMLTLKELQAIHAGPLDELMNHEKECEKLEEQEVVAAAEPEWTPSGEVKSFHALWDFWEMPEHIIEGWEDALICLLHWKESFTEYGTHMQLRYDVGQDYWSTSTGVKNKSWRVRLLDPEVEWHSAVKEVEAVLAWLAERELISF
jgi:hypothetical protein